MKLTTAGFLLATATVSFAGAQSIATYRARHRPAAELLAAAETALGADGRVTLDARTATLVLNAPPVAVKRALALLDELDRPLTNVVLESEIVGREVLDRHGLRVDWRSSTGRLSIGTVPLGPEGLDVALEASRSSSKSRSVSTLRLLEGETGTIATGEALPFVYAPYWGTRAVDFVAAETGFEARASLLGDGKVHLELRPFSGRLEPGGGLRYTEAATSIVVTPGSAVVVGETSRSSEERSTSLAGIGRTRYEERRVLLVSVELAEP